MLSDGPFCHVQFTVVDGELRTYTYRNLTRCASVGVRVGSTIAVRDNAHFNSLFQATDLRQPATTHDSTNG